MEYFIGDIVVQKNGLFGELEVIAVLSNHRVSVKTIDGSQFGSWEEYEADIQFVRHKGT